ncbi:MAG: oligosaccharide flippase family protein [Clostridia bacterium]|nr:oligosaccharide flippase family protein [Clostridia bacterium]
MRSVSKLFYTTIALTLTSFLMKTVAVWFNVYLAGLVGSVGMGIFQLIISVYAMSKTLAYGGVNLAATRLCIDDSDHARAAMRRVLLTAILLGLGAFVLLYFGADLIATGWIKSDQAAQPLRVLAFSLPFLAAASGLYGYMTAVRKMGRYSVIQLIEQVSRIVVTVAIIAHFAPSNTKEVLTLVCVGITISEMISFSLSVISYLLDLRKNKLGREGRKGLWRSLLRIAVPDALGSYLRSGLNTVEHLLIPWGIRRSGADTDLAFSQYGTVQGMALPILLYPSSILGVVSGLLVPEIAECKLKRNLIQVHYMIRRVLQVALIFSMATMAVMLLYAEKLSLVIYGSREAASFIQLLAPLIPVMYLDMTTDGMLKGLDLQMSIMKINILDSMLCVLLVFFLVPIVSVEGYLITIYVAEIINFLCSFYKLGKEAGARVGLWKNVILPFFDACTAFVMARALPLFTEKPTLNLIFTISVGLILYYLLLRITGSVSREDKRWFTALLRIKDKS